MPLPLLLIPVAAAATGGGFSAGTLIGSFTLGGGAAYGGYQAASYAYNGVRAWIDPSRVEKRDNKSLAKLLKVKEKKEKERMHNLDETVNGIQQRKQQLDGQVDRQQTELQEIMHGVDSDRAQIKEQTVHLTQTNEGLEQTARAQEELITRLQRELQDKMVAFEEAQRQLAASEARFEQEANELTETKEQTAASKAELAQVKDALIRIAKENIEKDNQLLSFEEKLLNKEQRFELEPSVPATVRQK